MPPVINVKEKESMPILKDDESDNVPSTNDARKELQGFFISGDEDVQHYLLKQLILSFMGEEEFNDEELEKIVKNSISLFKGLEPQDQVEAMLATQMVVTHNFLMSLIREGHRSNNEIRTEMFANIASKFARVFTAQVEALGRYRNKGKQKIVVEHVTVNEGGAAIVGAEITQGGGSKQ